VRTPVWADRSTTEAPSRNQTRWEARSNRIIRCSVMCGIALATLFILLNALAVQAQQCEYWVAPAPLGDDTRPGTLEQPWATLAHAAMQVPDNFCTVWVQDGVYRGTNAISRRFATPTTFKAVHAYMAILEHNGPVLKLSGAQNISVEGFELRHSGADATKHVVIVDRSSESWAEQITFRNNIFHDSYNNDLLKIHNGVRFATVEENVFYNQGDVERLCRRWASHHQHDQALYHHQGQQRQ